MHSTVERDAREFGRYAKGWRLGLLVARCIKRGRGGPRTGRNPASSKVSVREFADLSGVDRDTVSRYLKAWDQAAAAGTVPARDELRPGVDPELDFDALPPWEGYYVPRRPRGWDDEWYTRPEFVIAARIVLGGIDLDPASCKQAQKIVRAKEYYSLSERGEDGLELPWQGRVFLNPPFSRADEFGTRLAEEYYEAGNVGAAVMVVNGYNAAARWFEPFLDCPWCLATSPAFYRSGEDASNPSEDTSNPRVWASFVYLGHNHTEFTDTFSQPHLGRVFKDPTAREWQKRFSRPPA
jgi:hypothetical protein